MTTAKKLNEINTCLNKINSYYAITSLCNPSIDFIVTADDVFSPEKMRELNDLYNLFCSEKNYFLQNQLISTNNLNESYDYHSGSTSPVSLFRKLSFREQQDLISYDLNQAAVNLYTALRETINCITTKMTLQPNDLDNLNKIQSIINSFEGLLKYLSIYIEKLSDKEIHSSIFSLGLYLENLKRNYESQYKYTYCPSGMFSWFTLYYEIRKSFRNENRSEEIQFIMNINAHKSSTDELRRSAIEVVNRKIIDKESPRSSNTSILKKILNEGVNKASRTARILNENFFTIIAIFCKEHNLTIPKHLNEYLSDQMYSSNKAYLGE